MYGCELNDDGTKRGYFQFGYDGEDFVSLDKSSLTWTAASPQAVITKHKWEANRAIAEQQKAYLENTCIEWLQKYVRYGKDTLERNGRNISCFDNHCIVSTHLSCHATGFYPSGVTVTWQKNGQDHIEDVDLGQLIPNEDGTFQVTSTITVTPDELKNNKFSCVVEHQGETISNSSASVPIGIILAAVAGVLLLVVTGVAGYKVYQKKKGERDSDIIIITIDYTVCFTHLCANISSLWISVFQALNLSMVSFS
uniref:Major histocompatibility complex class I UBA n=1 Tax=Sinocyclocheilus anshuiensis TaxID=1608454 RepID=A0A671L3H8_9TELE